MIAWWFALLASSFIGVAQRVLRPSGWRARRMPDMGLARVAYGVGGRRGRCSSCAATHIPFIYFQF